MSSASFSRAHTQFLQPPEDPRYDEWDEAQQEKKQILEAVSELLGEYYLGPVDDLDELDEVIENLEADIQEIKDLRDELAKLEDDFPVPYIDEDPDEGW